MQEDQSFKFNKKPHKNLGKYQVGEEIGRGAYGTVYKGIDSDTGKFVAMKVCVCDAACG